MSDVVVTANHYDAKGTSGGAEFCGWNARIGAAVGSEQHPSGHAKWLSSLSKRPSNRFWPNDNLEFRCLATCLLAGAPISDFEARHGQLSQRDTSQLRSNQQIDSPKARTNGSTEAFVLAAAELGSLCQRQSFPIVPFPDTSVDVLKLFPKAPTAALVPSLHSSSPCLRPIIPDPIHPPLPHGPRPQPITPNPHISFH
ncbi:hypothetical protein PILCRDRAFT_12341 [Piloderma croceum F 1598]|uniref:Uncharacterized protein n=1 Tax=Piloderma croceum (strain F 1598) TaxID=765440 RepID=A0A0C3FB81_PILCF|nr:hypothetical protein PILCRDRAFT_12341 [Piloderma croceum F 1598]